ncbi:hypothetical protein PSEMO_50320 [Pseudomonas putida]|uniref:Uncharacterized protein n=1 Tax=Pseudomonas putida TaxID=303 RepID=A0A1Q9QY65_PSEPU|nr:hypothetical protein PSEMO_50320 [Pseudomonas putida]
MPLDFSVVLQYWPVLLKGLGLTQCHQLWKLSINII